jgi:hypothetical protein
MKQRMWAAQILCLVLFALPSSGGSQSQNPQPAPPSASSPASPNDVDNVEHIMRAVYDSISGPAGPRNWDRLRSLFYAGARLIPTRRDDKGVVTANTFTLEEYIERAKPYFDKEGFYETPVANRVETWDRIAHVWSTYESRHAKDEKPFARGINSFQLFNDGSRWWVLTIYWEGEDKDHPLPEKYLSR